MKKVIGSITVVLLILSSGCISVGEGFRVHEWGVFIKSYECENLSAMVFAPKTMFVKKPVIHFYAHGKIEGVKIEVSKIKDCKSDPMALEVNGNYMWNVTIDENLVVLPNGSKYPYIFYEGNLTAPTKVFASVHVLGENVTFHVKNQEDYPIFSIYLIYGYPTGKPEYLYRGLTYVRMDELEAGSEKTLTVKLRENCTYERESLFHDIISKGLTWDEATELLAFWESWWFYPTNEGTYTRLIYFIPQDVYDELIPISIKPKPVSIKRVGVITITDIPIVNNLSLELLANKSSCGINEEVRISLALHNLGNESTTLVFPSTKVADFEVLDESGKQIYLWSSGKVFAQVITRIEILPGERIELLNESCSIDKKGNYTIIGWLYTKPRMYSNVVRIEVT